MTSAVSVRDRLKRFANENKLSVERVFMEYAYEGLLRRLCAIECQIELVLKGGHLFNILFSNVKRPTRDMDFSAFGQLDLEEIKTIFESTIKLHCEDGLEFIPNFTVRELGNLNVVRVNLTAMLGNSPFNLSVDVGFQDEHSPHHASLTIESKIKENPKFQIQAFHVEWMVAEKFHAMVSHGMLNTRYKDFYDLHQIYLSGKTDSGMLAQGIFNTFNSWELAIPVSTKVSVLDEVRLASRHQERWAVFLRKNQLAFFEWDMAMDSIAALVDPSLKIIAEGKMVIDKELSAAERMNGAFTHVLSEYNYQKDHQAAWRK